MAAGLIILLLTLTNCKKTKTYTISQMMKDYFAFQKGSYWIYKNDSTGTLDSTYVNSYSHVYKDETYENVQREFISMSYVSSFLCFSTIGYVSCQGPDYYGVSSFLYLPQGEIQGGLDVAFYAGWPENTKVIPNCITGGIFYYKAIPSEMINNIEYKDILYSDLQAADTSPTNQNFALKRIYFAKNIGIIKFYEMTRTYNKSFSLLKYKVSQE